MARKDNGGPPTEAEQVGEFLEDAIEQFPEVQWGDLEQADELERREEANDDDNQEDNQEEDDEK